MDSVLELKHQFSKLATKYSDLGGVLKGLFEEKLVEEDIAFERIHYRVKSWDSFSEKIRIKNYNAPFDEIHDICGLRIIILNSGELDRVIEALKTEYNLIETEDKYDNLNPDQFGYRSHHLVISIKREWMSAPQFRNCENLKFEVQIRTELMDAWANISHQMFYKKGPMPSHFRRRLHRLSALMEIGDSEISQLIQSQPSNQYLSPEIQKLQDILDEHLPDRKRTSENSLVSLQKEMEIYNFPLETLIILLKTKKDKLLKIEQEAFSQIKPLTEIETRWWQIGVVRNFMYLTIDEYWLKFGKEYSDHFVSVIESHRKNF